MDRPHIVKGVNRFGEVVELQLLASSEIQAKEQAESAGLTQVAVTEAKAEIAPPWPDAPDAPPPAAGG